MRASSNSGSGMVSSRRHNRMLIVLLPCFAIIVCILILFPAFKGLAEYLSEKHNSSAPSSYPAAVSFEPHESAILSPSLQQIQWDACQPDRRSIVLSASSTERDMYIIVRDDSGNVITDEILPVYVTSPFGDTSEYRTTGNGSCHIVDLTPGQYSVYIPDSEGYSSSQPVSCTVKASVEYVPIENISRVIQVVDALQIPVNEIKGNTVHAAEVTVPEVIFTPPEAAAVEAAPAVTALVDSNGCQLFSYTYELGSGGHLLYRGTNQESDVVPVDEDNDGVYDYGIRYESITEPSSPAPDTEATQDAYSGGYYVSVALYNSDNTPVELFAISASPLVSEPLDMEAGFGWRSENGHTYYYSQSGEKEIGLKSIDGRLYYFNERGEKASSIGIDVSCFNGHIDWQSVKVQGVDFAIMRVGGRGWSSGLLYEDTCIKENLRNAANAGLKIGVYFYSCAINPVEAVEEASLVLEKLGGAHLDYPVFLDMEYSGSYPRGRADTLSTAMRVDIARAFCKTIMSSGYAAGIYASESYMKQALDFYSLSRYSYWLANYTENNRLPGFSGRYSIWQFTDSARIAGISGLADMNVIF